MRPDSRPHASGTRRRARTRSRLPAVRPGAPVRRPLDSRRLQTCRDALRPRERYPAATGPLVVHRLDMDTSGVLLLALTKEAHQDLQAQFKHRTVRKRYIALLEGRITPPKGRIELPLRPDLHDRPRQAVDPLHGKPAITEYEVLEFRNGRTRGPSIGTQCSDRGRPTVRNSRPAVASACRTDRIPPSGDRRSDSD